MSSSATLKMAEDFSRLWLVVVVVVVVVVVAISLAVSLSFSFPLSLLAEGCGCSTGTAGCDGVEPLSCEEEKGKQARINLSNSKTRMNEIG
jgi:hypothetical protein